ncbi:MAG: sn-glycerol-3-phosphate ABC transporter substrate-binding protein UgpB [Alphaproteobacteria bacterium]
MIARRSAIGITLAAALAWSVGAEAAPREVNFWYPLGGAIGDLIVKMTDDFNASQDKYKVVPQFKGSYDETFNAAVAAYRAKKHPHLLVVIGASSLNMMLSGAVYPVEDLLKDNGHQVDWSGFVQPVLNYYRTPEGKLLSLPFNSSTPIFWYNKDAFAKAGVDKVPETWDEVGEAAAKLRASGFECGYTSAWQVWANIDNYSFLHDQPVATRQNGMAGIDTEFLFNKTRVVQHIARIQEWAKDGRFVYSGREWKGAHGAFSGGKCAMMTESSAGHAAIKQAAKFTFGASYLPHEKGVVPKNSLIGGGSIWAMSGHPKEDYAAVAAYLAFLTSTERQVQWHKGTGYIPITKAAYEKAKADGYYKENPHQEVAILQLSREGATENTKAVRLGNYVQYVSAIEDELENIWAQKKPAQQGLDDAVRRGNEILARFAQQNRPR